MAKPAASIQVDLKKLRAQQLSEALSAQREIVWGLRSVVDKLQPKLLPARRFLQVGFIDGDAEEELEPLVEKLVPKLVVAQRLRDAEEELVRAIAKLLEVEEVREADEALSRAELYLQHLEEEEAATKLDNVAAASSRDPRAAASGGPVSATGQMLFSASAVASGAAAAEPHPARKADEQQSAQQQKIKAQNLDKKAEDLYNKVRRHPDFNFFDDVEQRATRIPRFATGGDSRADIEQKKVALKVEKETIRKWVQDQCRDVLNTGGSVRLKDDGGHKEQFAQFVKIIRDLERQLPREFWDLSVPYQPAGGARARA